MRAPCGHAEAQCVIGNYWNCARCDGVAKPVIEVYRTPVSQDQVFFRDNIIVERKPQATSNNPLGSKLLLSCAQEVLKACGEKIAPGIERKDDFFGTTMAFHDPATNATGYTKHDRHYGRTLIRKDLDARVVVDQLYATANAFVSAVNSRIEAVVNARGWSRYRLATLGSMPHVVAEDGVLPLEDQDTYSVTLRAFWGVVPA